MSIDVSIARRSCYENDGSFNADVCEILIEHDDEFRQSILIDNPSDLLVLNRALSHYIATNHIDKTQEP